MKTRNWFNEEEKLKFAKDEEVPSSHKVLCEKLFAVSAPAEYEFGKDISNWERKLVIRFLEETASFSFRTMKEKLLGLNSYFRWMNSDISEIEIEDLDLTIVTRKEMFGCPDDLQVLLDKVFDTVSMNTSHNLIRSILWLYYMGMSTKDIYELKEDQIDLPNKKIVHGEQVFIIPNEAIPCFRKCLQADGFMIYNKTAHLRRRAPGNKFVRFFSEIKDYKNYDRNNLKNKINKLYVEKNLSFDTLNIVKSGHFYRHYQMELAGVQPNYRQIAREIYEKDVTATSVLPVASKAEYKLWKKTFYPETKM